jgi:hypothetical protein
VKVFKTRMLRKMFRPKQWGEWGRLHSNEVYDLYSSSNIIWVNKSRITRWARHVACMGEKRGAYMVLMGRSEGNRPLERPRPR